MTLRRHSQIMGLVQGVLWLVVGLVLAGVLMFPNFAQEGRISAAAAVLFIGLASWFAGVIAVVTAVNTTRKDFHDGKIQLTPEELAQGSRLARPRRPMWLIPMVGVSLQWLVPTALVAGMGWLLFPEGMPNRVFIPTTALVLALHGALAAWWTSSRELLKYAAHAAEEPTPFRWYVLREHISGNSLINLTINPLMGYVMYHAGPKHPSDWTDLKTLALDLLVMSVMVAVLVPPGADMQAAADLHERRTPGPKRDSKNHPGLVARNLVYLAVAAAAGLLCWAAFAGLGLDSFSLSQVMALKGVESALVAAVVAGLAARWSAAKTLAVLGPPLAGAKAE